MVNYSKKSLLHLTSFFTFRLEIKSKSTSWITWRSILPRKRWATFIHVIICNVKWWPELDFLFDSGTCQTIKHWIESDLIYNWTMSFQNKIGPFDWFRGLIYFCESWHFPSINIEIIRTWKKTKITLHHMMFEKH